MSDPIPEMVTPQVVHVGRNRTCCLGKCFINSEPWNCFGTLLMINIPVAATLALTCKQIWAGVFLLDLEGYIWRVLTVILVYLAFGSNFNMLKCVMVDPGIVPARRWPDYVSKKYDEPRNRDDYYTQFWAVNQRNSAHFFKFTFCKTCQIFQPPRCNHCPFCQTCVLELDHHCLWLGTCLGRRNYRSFYWFLVHLVLLTFFELGFIVCYMWRLAENRILRN